MKKMTHCDVGPDRCAFCAAEQHNRAERIHAMARALAGGDWACDGCAATAPIKTYMNHAREIVDAVDAMLAEEKSDD